MSDKTKQPAANTAVVDELQRVIAAKDQELATTYALINHYKRRVDDLDVKLIETAMQLHRTQQAIGTVDQGGDTPAETTTH
ncbi:hypothetical protein D5400_12680 [Georhizobium profundi]|uniref:Uncharacterized protein n=1 Tax=Georhizobium profundi TaxID=2341112 RepID=A0A3Q8XR00_9HYPH|nr:hypothetical protein [Georhizobium profundi]AZN72019.1 hypothetical protein D5400_12680 [Georhizobium profundi]